MSVLALKALDYGADKIPDKLFHSIPGGYFKPRDEEKSSKSSRDSPRHRSEQRRSDRSQRRSRRDRSPPSDYSDTSEYDNTDYERETRRRRRRRVKSMARSLSRSLSRGRHNDRSRDLDREYDQLERADHTERGPQFPPPPTSEYRPYDPHDYDPAATAGLSATNGYYDSYDNRASSTRPDYGYPPQPVSSTAARYTPAAGYAPSPVNSTAPPTNPVYAPYNPADYATPSQGFKAPRNTYPSPPPFYRQSSHSQPSIAQYPPYADGYNQVSAYEPPSERHGSTSSSGHRRHGDDRRHRARSAGHHGRSRSSVTDKFRDRFESLDVHDKGLAASVGGALAGGFAGSRVGHGTLSTLIGAGIGAIGGRELEKRYEKQNPARERSKAGRGNDRHDYRRSRSRARQRDDGTDGTSDSGSHDRGDYGRRRRSRSRRERDY